MTICECCGEDVLDLDEHFPCDCKFSIKRLWLVSFTLPAAPPKLERHVCTKITFTVDQFEVVHVDGSTCGFQADLVENYSIQPLKIGVFRNMSGAERATVIACWDDMWRATKS